MAERRFLLVDADVLPEVFVKVLQAKELLASGAVSNISAAAKQAGISRSAFYKYKDTVFDAETGRESITVVATLLDQDRRAAEPALGHFGGGCLDRHHHPVPPGEWRGAGGGHGPHRHDADAGR